MSRLCQRYDASPSDSAPMMRQGSAVVAQLGPRRAAAVSELRAAVKADMQVPRSRPSPIV